MVGKLAIANSQKITESLHGKEFTDNFTEPKA